MRKERRKKKSEEKREKKHFRGTNVIFEFGLSFVNAIFMTKMKSRNNKMPFGSTLEMHSCTFYSEMETFKI